MSSVSHQSLAQTLLTRKWGIQEDDTFTVVPTEPVVSYDIMGKPLLADRRRLKHYVRQIVHLEVADLRTGDRITQIDVDTMDLRRVTDNFPSAVADIMIPQIRAQIRRLLSMITPPEEYLQGATASTKLVKNGDSIPKLASDAVVVGTFAAFDDDGEEKSSIKCADETILGRRNFERNPEVLSTVSRKLFSCHFRDGTLVLSKTPASCPLWFSVAEEVLRQPFKEEISVSKPTYIYHDRNDTALGCMHPNL